MLISFIISTRNVSPTFERTFKSIMDQKNKNFEVILVLDRTIAENSKANFGKDIFWANSNVKLVLNNSVQGISTSYNIAINVAKGEYIKFVNEGDLLELDFVDEIQKTVAEHANDKLDIIEYTAKLAGMADADADTVTYLERNHVYDLETQSEPIAYINLTIYNKIYRTKLLQVYLFKFRRFVRFDALFTYKVLTRVKKYLHIGREKPLETIQIEKVEYSVFDTVNQWIHIFNYYRRMGKFKEYKDELNYAYFKCTLHIWLWTIKQYEDKALLKKVVDYVNKKFVNKMDEFIQTNTIFSADKDKKFTEICNNFTKYMKDILK